MKRSALTLTLLLPAFCAAAAAAQMIPIRFAAPVNPVAGIPQLLPSPLIGPLAGADSSLLAPLPILTPSLIPAPAPFALTPREGRIPATPAKRSRDGVVDPLRRSTPGVAIRFAVQETPAKPASALPDASKEKLDGVFDGEGDPAKPVVKLPNRKAAASGRRIGLPEWDLERELGL